ncbi:MAG: hypothetical protein AAGI11_15135 [Pseudomonadota bacterium]
MDLPIPWPRTRTLAIEASKRMLGQVIRREQRLSVPADNATGCRKYDTREQWISETQARLVRLEEFNRSLLAQGR